ncbi:uncharacterized protein LOC128553183, partial [Mercenaria mercenaria]|uniref:uncharacterized protein LOC128553183 n=1 Tax=Mercenaria mercenaria TaxID=6596 RepID=UPI00234F7F22
MSTDMKELGIIFDEDKSSSDSCSDCSTTESNVQNSYELIQPDVSEESLEGMSPGIIPKDSTGQQLDDKKVTTLYDETSDGSLLKKKTAMSEEDITRGHELYLRHLLLLEQAAPESLKAIIEREVSKRGKSLAYLLAERKDTFNKYHNAEFRQLFKGEEVNTDIDSLDILVLCTIVLVLFESHLATVELEAIKVIKDQRNDLENDAHSASINYKTFEEKWVPLHLALLELIKGIHDKKRTFECTRMIHSFKSEHIRVRLDLIQRIKQTNDVKLHLQMVMQDKVAPNIHGDTDETCDKDEENEADGKTILIDKALHVATVKEDVRENMDIVLICTVSLPTNKVVWRHNGRDIKQHTRHHVSVQELEHKLTIRNAKFEDNGEYTVDFRDVASSTTLALKDNPVFTEMLQDRCVFLGEPAILTCRLNASEKAVTWRHDYKPVEETDTVILVNKECAHWLAISNAKLADAGHYSCTCGDSSTSAFLKISDKPLKITKSLHVATAEADVRENMDVVLMCEVNRHTNNVVWRHNSQVIKPCNRRVVSVDDLEHKLSVRNAKFQDEGDYTVDFADNTSSVQLTIKGNLNFSHKKQLTEELYRNWIRGALGLKYLKIGLERFSDTTVNKHHCEMVARLPTSANICTNCTEELLLPSHAKKNCPNKSKCLCSKSPKKRKICPSGGFCSTFHDQILYDHRFNDPLLKNTDIQKWSSDPWSIATCYIGTTGYKGKTSAKDVDCAGLLSIFINNTFFHRSLGDVEINGETDLFKQAREARNDILHNANYELSEGQLRDYIDLFINALEIRDLSNGRTPLSDQRDVQEAIKNLNELRDKQIEVHVSEDLKKEIRELHEHAMSELADNVQEAIKQSHIKVQQLKEKLKNTEENLQLMRDLRSTQMKSKESKPFELELHIRVVGPTRETSTEGNQRIYKSMNEYTNSLSIDTDTPVHSTDQSVHRLLGYINTIKDCKIVDVLNTEHSVNMKIHCFTCKAIADFLTSVNGKGFLNETIVLRKSLEMQEHIKVHDVIVSCPSESTEGIRKRLDKRDFTTDFNCGNHQGTQCTRACAGLKQVVSERSYREQNQSLVVKRKIGKYKVRIKKSFMNKDDYDDKQVEIRSIRMLPDGNILLIDNNNDRLKKLDSSYNVVSHCVIHILSHSRTNVCYIGEERAVVCNGFCRIQFVNLSGNMKLEHDVKLEHHNNDLVCHGDTLYVRDDNTVYTYNRHFQEKHVLFNIQDLTRNIIPVSPRIMTHMAISDNGERIYISNNEAGLVTIDNKG